MQTSCLPRKGCRVKTRYKAYLLCVWQSEAEEPAPEVLLEELQPFPCPFSLMVTVKVPNSRWLPSAQLHTNSFLIWGTKRWASAACGLQDPITSSFAVAVLLCFHCTKCKSLHQKQQLCAWLQLLRQPCCRRCSRVSEALRCAEAGLVRLPSGASCI